ncbi:MAG: DUF2079 domain-containing protein [Candidatus Thermoplasmatota archaeon]|nr:DUF2079 domain-containing protein [Candidatus Thermoplasmatota archaeon]
MENQKIIDKGILSPFQKKFLVVIIPFLVFVMASISYIRYLDFYTSNWDLGLEMQMLADSFHGYILYEAADFETYGVVSHLEIHSSYIALLFSYVYQTLSDAVLLFICQALFFSLSLIPLNAISRYYGLSDRQSLFVSILYVTNVGLIASQMYDFHWMSLIPVEFLAFFFFLIKRRFLLSFLILVIGSLTLEVFPPIALGPLLFLYYEDIKHETNVKAHNLTKYRLSLISLAILSITILIIIKEVQYEILPTLLHQPDGIGPLGHDSPESLFPVSLSLYSSSLSLLYWGIIYGSLGFLPLFYRRHLLIVLPWLYESILVVPSYSAISEQYGFVALPPLFIGLLLALKRGISEPIKFARILRSAMYILMTCVSAVIVYDLTYQYSLPYRIALSVFTAIIILTAMLIFVNRPFTRQYIIKQKKPITYAITFVLVLIITFNFLVGPLNPVNEERTVDSGYAFSYSLNPEYQSMIKIVSGIPKNASIISSDNLFPYISNDPNAFSFYWNTPENLTFSKYYNLSANFSFTYVLIDQSQMSYIPQGVLNHIQTSYGLSSVIYTEMEYPGNIYLYKLGYTGKTSIMYV